MYQNYKSNPSCTYFFGLQNQCMLGDLYQVCQWMVLLPVENKQSLKLIPRKSVPPLRRPCDPTVSTWSEVQSFHMTLQSPTCQPYLLQTRVFPRHLTAERKSTKDTDGIFTCSSKEMPDLAPVVPLPPFASTLRKWTHFHTFQPLRSAHSTISHAMSNPRARPALMVITPGSFDVHRFILTHTKREVKT